MKETPEAFMQPTKNFFETATKENLRTCQGKLEY